MGRRDGTQEAQTEREGSPSGHFADRQIEEVVVMLMKLGLWVGTPSAITFLASSYSMILENIMFLFMLCLGALLVAILPQLLDTNR